MAHPKKRPAEHEEEGPSAERWLLTYADMITLLMVLFIVLFALGQTDIRKFNAFKDSFHWLSTSEQSTPPGGPGVLSQPSAIALTLQNPFARLTIANANSASGEQQMGYLASGQTKSGHKQSGKTSGKTRRGRPRPQRAGISSPGRQRPARRSRGRSPPRHPRLPKSASTWPRRRPRSRQRWPNWAWQTTYSSPTTSGAWW